MEYSSLDQIFNQIIESERMVEKERMLLLQAQADVGQCEKLIKDKREVNLSLEEQMSVVSQQVYEENVNSDTLQNKERILSQKKRILQQRKDAHLKDQEAMNEQLHLNRLAFCDEMDSFITTIGLQLRQPDHIAYNLETQLVNIKQEEKQLTKVINDFNKYQDDANEYQQKNEQIRLKLKEQEQQLEELHEVIEQRMQYLQIAKKEEDQIGLKPNTDLEFQSIRQQINFYQQNNGEIEQQCAERQGELNQLLKWKKLQN